MQKSFTVTEETIQAALSHINIFGHDETNGFDSVFSCPICKSIPGCLRVGYNYIRISLMVGYHCTPELRRWQTDGSSGENPGTIRVVLDDMSNGRKVARLRRIKGVTKNGKGQERMVGAKGN